MADGRGIARMNYIPKNYDDAELLSEKSKEYPRDKNQVPAPRVRFWKRVDGTYYVIEAVPDTDTNHVKVAHNSLMRKFARKSEFSTFKHYFPFSGRGLHNVRN